MVSYGSSPWLEVVSVNGQVLQQFVKRGHFKSPFFMCTAPDGSIFISDYHKHTITKVDDPLNVLQTFNSPLLKKPHGITAVTEDHILVGSYWNHRLLLLQPSTNTVTTLLGEDDGIDTPHSLAYCPDLKKVYTAKWNTNIIAVYQVKSQSGVLTAFPQRSKKLQITEVRAKMRAVPSPRTLCGCDLAFAFTLRMLFCFVLLLLCFYFFVLYFILPKENKTAFAK